MSNDPIRLDRSKWEPCELCAGDSLDCVGVGDRFGFCVYLCGGRAEPPEAERVRFCPKCSRPLTDAAWGELEQRLRRCAVSDAYRADEFA